MNWLCWHVGTATDPKWIVVSKRCGNAPKHMVVAVVALMFERAKEINDDGRYGPLNYEVAGAALDIAPEQLRDIEAAMAVVNVAIDGKIVNWSKRNHGGSSTKRVREFRERQRNGGNGETLRGVSGNGETLQTGQDRQTRHNNPHSPPTRGTRRNGRTGPAASAVLMADIVAQTEATWRERLKGYDKNRFWPDSWGPQPGQEGCQAPTDLVAEVLEEPEHAGGGE